MRALITGAAGFVGHHLADRLAADGHEIVGVGRSPESPIDHDYVTLDLRDADATKRAIAEIAPEWTFHLAADASVGRSWREPQVIIRNNLETTLNVLDACDGSRVLVAGSAEIYGVPRQLPVTEEHQLAPQNPYASSKAAIDIVAAFYGRHDVIRTRAFNHFGPGQTPDYVVAAFASQIADAEREKKKHVLVETGELNARRDFTDVRDVVRAYVLLLERGDTGAYNICSGVSRSAADILAALGEETDLEIESRVDPDRLRKNEVMDIHGSHDKLTDATGWQPEIAFETTIADTLEWWRTR
jgi:GDP-4-dehydro-6-deoxy-D-mannose reductase